MQGNLVRRLAVIAFAVGLSAFFLIRNYRENGTPIKRGLDLVGGMYLAIQVRDPDGTLTAESRRDMTDQALQVIRNRVDQFGVSEPVIQKFGDDRIIVELPAVQDEERARNIVRQTAFLEFQLVKPTNDVIDALPRIDRAVLQAFPDAGKEEGAERDTTTDASTKTALDALFNTQRDTTAAVDTTAADSANAPVSNKPEDRPLTNLLRNSGSEGEFLVSVADVNRVTKYLSAPEVQRALPRGIELKWGDKPLGQAAGLYQSLYVLDKDAFMNGSAIEDAGAGKDTQFNNTIVTFQLNRKGGRTFEKVTGANINHRIAIVLDDKVKSAPNVLSRISMNGQIEMGTSPMTEARDLALVLRSGALPAEIEILEQRSIGPTLGKDEIEKGQMAGTIGVVLVILIMCVIYRFAGFLAILALGIYVILVLGGLAAFGAALTAPGIAGLVLSIGMAVDANILIFERIREEMLAGKTQRIAVDEGFRHALSAIVDSNLSSIITALILYQVGTGPVRGFAVTLILGVVASFFSAVFITRTFFMIYIDKKAAAKPISI